jgi:hypothetical protein
MDQIQWVANSSQSIRPVPLPSEREKARGAPVREFLESTRRGFPLRAPYLRGGQQPKRQKKTSESVRHLSLARSKPGWPPSGQHSPPFAVVIIIVIIISIVRILSFVCISLIFLGVFIGRGPSAQAPLPDHPPIESWD